MTDVCRFFNSQMKLFTKVSAAALVASALAPATMADGRNPGSALVYPIHRSGSNFFTVVSVTNTNTEPAFGGLQLGGTTNAHFNYVNTIANAANPKLPLDCFVTDRLETLTPADTLSVLTSCHNAASAEGYLMVYAADPLIDDGKTPWSHNYLVGSELVVTALGGIYSINAIPFEALAGDAAATDADGDEQLDFDGVEYEEIADTLIIDSFVAATGSSLTLINMTGGTRFDALVQFDIWNDNEKPLSATKLFRCWMEESLQDVSAVFSDAYLANNTPNDPQELDLNCDGVGDLETGWALINGQVASSLAEAIQNPALLGAITAGPAGMINGGRLLWESSETQDNGDFIKFGTDDPEE